MNIKTRLKSAFIRRSLNKRRISGPFVLGPAELFTLPHDANDKQNNSYYFSGHDMQGSSLLFRFAQRGIKKTEVWFAYKNTAGKAYINDIQLYTGETPAGVKCIKPGENWEFFWNGELRDIVTGRKCGAGFRGGFISSGNVFEFGHDVDAGVMAKAIAEQKWSKKFFSELSGNDQTHYEQPGIITGTLSLDGKETEIKLTAMRDHSFGKREWGYMNRHFWLMALFEDGSSLNANMVSYPVLCLETGYYISKGKTVSVESAKISGEVKPNAVPESFGISVKLSDGRSLEVACKKEAQFEFPFDNGAYTIYEGIGSFESGGIMGRGVLEFGWNGDASRYA
jgi:hypothetical protein